MTLSPARPAPFLTIVSLLVLSLPSAAATLDVGRPDVQAFVARMHAEHGFDPVALTGVLSRAEIRDSILEAISRPAERTKPWHEYRQIFLTEKRIDAGLRFWSEHEATLTAASERTGVAPEIIVAIVGVETFYGRITGSYRVVDSLATLAFEYPPRAAFFESELEEFFLLAREQGIDPMEPKGSYAGAMGAPQFISSSYRAYAVDGNGDERVDLWNDWSDVLASVANYFRRHGWQAGEPVAVQVGVPEDGKPPLSERLRLDTTVGALRDAGVAIDDGSGDDVDAMLFELEGGDGPEYWVGYRNFYVITRYNRSNMYAMAIKDLGEALVERRQRLAHGG